MRLAPPNEVQGPRTVSPLDALIIINDINARGPRALSGSPSGSAPIFYFDANGDGSVSPIDALLVINRLNSPLTNAEGETSTMAIVHAREQFVDSALPVQFMSDVAALCVSPPPQQHRSAYARQSTMRETQVMPSYSLSAEQSKAARHSGHRSYDARKAENADLELALDMIVDDLAIALFGRRSLETGAGEQIEAMGPIRRARYA